MARQLNENEIYEIKRFVRANYNKEYRFNSYNDLYFDLAISNDEVNLLYNLTKTFKIRFYVEIEDNIPYVEFWSLEK